MGLDAPDLAAIVANPARVADLRAAEVPSILGALEELRSALWARMLVAPAGARDPVESSGEPLLTVAEVAVELQFTRAYVYDAVRTGQLPALRTGKYVRIRRAALTAWLDGRSAIALDGHTAPLDSVRLTGRGRAQPVSRRAQPPPPRREDVPSPMARRGDSSAARVQRTGA